GAAPTSFSTHSAARCSTPHCARSPGAVGWCGRLVVVGFAAGGIPTVKTNYLLLKNIEVSGLQVSDYRKRRPAQVAACYAEIFDLYAAGRLQPDAAIAFPLDRAGEALAALRDRRLTGRAVLQPGDG